MTRLFHFLGGAAGAWRVLDIRAPRGDTLAGVGFVSVARGDAPTAPAAATWTLRGVVSNLRYATGAEVTGLAARQQGLGRPAATQAALIPIRKTAAWWALPQDARRAIFEEMSHHTRIGMDYLPAVARQLHHCRDLGEPFDFLTWFEFAPADAPAFDAMLGRLRASEEWRYVDREVEVRLERA